MKNDILTLNGIYFSERQGIHFIWCSNRLGFHSYMSGKLHADLAQKRFRGTIFCKWCRQSLKSTFVINISILSLFNKITTVCINNLIIRSINIFINKEKVSSTFKYIIEDETTNF